ncbi:hypothetical protein PN441_11900 [Spirulina major CS-329]|uniref:hypothetical protein n=1 Tax=Spirulina TaxID=1154 RepID=UPI00232ED900|nr:MULTISPECIES: hypothetical protein [Spirulina]MDB9495790.1 hypothetical protein [Spirulina subsalsa CS-330]MDB9503776.1 hypothetical protein [Spirulina major CS-329]
MNYPIPRSPEEIRAFQKQPIDEEMVAAAIAGVVEIYRAQGKSVDQIQSDILTDHQLLNPKQRQWLSEVLTQAWQTWPEQAEMPRHDPRRA